VQCWGLGYLERLLEISFLISQQMRLSASMIAAMMIMSIAVDFVTIGVATTIVTVIVTIMMTIIVIPEVVGVDIRNLL
jgi:F0F1-type ATP synthase membrane subunit a